jgi:hypothetical protein
MILKVIRDGNPGYIDINQLRHFESVIENRQVELVEAFRVGDHIDFDNLSVFDYEGCYQEQASMQATTAPTVPFTRARCANWAGSAK